LSSRCAYALRSLNREKCTLTITYIMVSEQTTVNINVHE